MSTDYVVRLAGPEHLDQLPAIERAAATRFGDSLPRSVLSHVTPLDILEEAQLAGLLWVALEPAGTPVGFAVASVHERRMHLDELDVLPEHGRKGVGSALVKAVEDCALNGGCMEITLTTFSDVPWNAPFYVGAGFEVVAEQELDEELLRRLSDETDLGLDRTRRVAMRKSLGLPTSGSRGVTPVLEIHSASEDDQPSLQAALAWAIDWRDAAPAADPATRIASTGHDYLLDGWGREGDLAFVATVNEIPVGAAWYRFWTDDVHSYGYVDSRTPEIGIGVDPSVRGVGVGTALLRRLTDEARARGVGALSLSVEEDNPALDWYVRCGFERHARVADSWTMLSRLGDET